MAEPKREELALAARAAGELGLGEGDPPETVASVLERFLERDLDANLSENQRAARAWHAANGSVEHAHTTGVFVKPPKAEGELPTLGVYLDSQMRVVDFRANRELYVERLANQGLMVADVEFRLTRYPVASASSSDGARGAAQSMPAEDELPELSPDEVASLEELVSGLPEPLRSKALDAACLSIRRERSRTSRE